MPRVPTDAQMPSAKHCKRTTGDNKIVKKGDPPQVTTIRGDRGFGSSSLNDGIKIWVQWPNGPPEPAEVIAVGKDNTILITRPGEKKREYVPTTKCYLQE